MKIEESEIMFADLCEAELIEDQIETPKSKKNRRQ